MKKKNKINKYKKMETEGGNKEKSTLYAMYEIHIKRELGDGEGERGPRCQLKRAPQPIEWANGQRKRERDRRTGNPPSTTQSTHPTKQTEDRVTNRRSDALPFIL